MSAQPLGFVEGFTRAWVGVYTAGASAPVRAARLDEIVSDLWEHRRADSERRRSEAATASDVLGRLARGVPADITWRLRTGGLQMQSKFVIERTTGALMVMIVLLTIGGIAGSPPVGSGEPYFSEDFPGFVQQLDAHARSLGLTFAAGAAMIAASVLLFSTFRSHGTRLAIASAGALAVAGVMFVATAVAGVRLHALAEVWRDGGVRGDTTWLAAASTANYVESLGILAVFAMAASFVTVGALIARGTPLPRWLGVLGLVGAGTVLLAMPGLATGVEAFWMITMLGVLVLLAAIVVTGGWLLVRGTRPLAGRGAAE